MLTETQIKDNWDRFLKEIYGLNGGEILYSFYDENANRFATMPASGNTAYHNAFVGGYVDHVLNVLYNARKLKKLWEEAGANIDFTDEELDMVALNHDLGKYGDHDFEYYIPQDSDWHQKRGEVFKHNPLLSHMDVHDRSLFILQELGVKLTLNEYLGIKLHDGLYDEGNKSYYVTYSAEKRLRSNLPYIIHQADLMSARVEFDLSKNNKPKLETLFTLPDKPAITITTKDFYDNQSKKSKVKKNYSKLLK